MCSVWVLFVLVEGFGVVKSDEKVFKGRCVSVVYLYDR